MVEDYTYEEADFYDDLELAFPEGEVWTTKVRKDTIHCVFIFCILFHFYL